jgi:CheY-like chemotaxis protein
MKFPNRYRILYAEDNEEACFMLTTLLGFSGIDATCAFTVKEAFEQAQNEHFDLYLLDGRFPEGSGLELCRQLRELSPQTPIVFYSSDAYETDRQKALAAGAQAYLVKPEVETIVPTILRLVAQVSETAKIQESDELRASRFYGQISLSTNP